MSKAEVFFPRIVVAAALLIASLGTQAQEPVSNDKFKDVLNRGVLRVGVQGAFKPWGFRAEDGTVQGIEIDLAKDVADKMGVKMEPVVITSANRMQFLQQGKIDLIVGAMADTPERRQIVGMGEPAYWTSGPTMMVRKGTIKSWDDIRGKPVCGKQGNWYNRDLEEKFGAKVSAFTGNSEGKQSLLAGRCVAWVYEDISIAEDLQSPGWKDYEMVGKPFALSAWATGVPLEEKNGIWGAFMSGMVYQWHSSGKLIELEKKWNVMPSEWHATEHAKFHYDPTHMVD
jgi:polar amino acid transport system substrate-binding protein